MRIYNEKDAEEIGAEPWMCEILNINPSYVFWGNFEDYMHKDGQGWDSAQEIETPANLWHLDELNECVNFYFAVDRDSKQCASCEACGLNPASKLVHDDYYDFAHTGRKWVNNITQDEVAALVEHGRLHDFTSEFVPGAGWKRKEPPYMPTAAEVNEWSKRGIGHDAINRSILVETRCKRLGVWGHCEACEGKGYLYTEDRPRLALQLWMLHPRKGCSRGLYVRSVQRDELPKVAAWLEEARKRNDERFSRLGHLCC